MGILLLIMPWVRALLHSQVVYARANPDGSLSVHGNRVEVCAGGFLIFDPDYEPVVWSQAERAKGQAWGMQTVASFHIKGTPPVPEEDVLLARQAGH